jgi:Pentapeptide repeats (8 copies)
MKMLFEIRNRWTGAVKFTAEIECTDSDSYGVKVGLAVKWAIKMRAVLTGADLTGAVLTDADLTRAVLTGANLTDAVLTRADLTDADLTGAVLTRADLTRADLTRAVLTGANLTRADLTRADLTGANLTGADLTDADLTGAVLTDAVLTGAVLPGADLRSFKADFWMTLVTAKAEVPGLIKALREGRVNGSTYEGDCACLVGTIANVRGVSVSNLARDASAPAERWFMMINTGDKPGDASGGGFASAKALEWATEFCRLNGIEIPIDDSGRSLEFVSPILIDADIRDAN